MFYSKVIEIPISGNARKKDKYKRMKQQEVKKEAKAKAAKAGGKVTPVTGKNLEPQFTEHCHFLNQN